MAEGDQLSEDLSRSVISETGVYFDFTRYLCHEKGRHVEAVGYCKDCSDYLCEECYKSHCRHRPWRHHVLFDRQSLPKDFACREISTVKPSSISSASSRLSQAVGKTSEASKTKPLRHSPLSPETSPGQHEANISLLPTNTYTTEPSSSKTTDGTSCEGSMNTPVHAERKVVNARHVTDIKVKVKHDVWDDCWIMGLHLLPGGKLVAVDYNNDNVKVIDARTQTLIYDLKLQSKPWDVTSVDCDKVAVTLPPANTIQYLIVSTDGIVNTNSSIDVKGSCHGIAFARDRLYVSYTEPPKVEILTLDGEVQHCIGTSASGHQLFSYPAYLALNPDRETIYVSEFNKTKIFHLSSTGTVLAVYKDEDFLPYPVGIAVTADGTVCVCDAGGEVIMLMIQCNKIKILLDMDQVRGLARSLAYNETTKQLFLGMTNGGIIKVFQLS